MNILNPICKLHPHKRALPVEEHHTQREVRRVLRTHMKPMHGLALQSILLFQTYLHVFANGGSIPRPLETVKPPSKPIPASFPVKWKIPP